MMGWELETTASIRDRSAGRPLPAAHAGKAGAEIEGFRQRSEFGGTGPDDQLIAHAEDMVADILADHLAPGLDADDLHAGAAHQLGRPEFLADERAAFGDDEVGEVEIAFRIIVERALRAIGQEPGPGKHEIGRARQRRDETHAGDFEHAERGEPLFARDAIDEEIGRGADQRERAAQDREVG